MASEFVQLLLLTTVGLLLGWSPRGSILAVVVMLLLGTTAFSGLGLLMAGTLRAEATLPAANLIFILLLGAGGVVVPLDHFPAAAQRALGLLPITALAHGLREVLQHGNSLPLWDVGILATWAVAGVAAAAKFFRWE
jgi:ABC-2 type transport system permease protein